MREARESVLVYFEAWILTLRHIRAQILNSIPDTHGKACFHLVLNFMYTLLSVLSGKAETSQIKGTLYYSQWETEVCLEQMEK